MDPIIVPYEQVGGLRPVADAGVGDVVLFHAPQGLYPALVIRVGIIDGPNGEAPSARLVVFTETGLVFCDGTEGDALGQWKRRSSLAVTQ